MDLTDARLAELFDGVEELRGDRVVTPLSGGLTNHNFKVDSAAGSFVVRISDPDTGLLAIDRDNEHVNSVAAAASGVGPEVITYQPENAMLVIAFIPDTETMSRETMQRGDRLAAAAAAIRQLHAGPAMRANPEALVPCNTDLLAENFLWDGRRFRLIDWEYSGMNEASFELGNVWSESDLSLAQLEELVAAYWGEATPAKVARARMWGLMSKYGWTLWGVIQHNLSDIDFDFWEWLMDKHDRATLEFDGPDFDRLVADIESDVA